MKNRTVIQESLTATEADSLNPSTVSAQSPLSTEADPPLVTIVVVPRERFSCARQSLESILANTRIPFSMRYVDGNSPKVLRQYLKQQAQAHSFELLRTETYLYPNQARNLGAAGVTTPYIAFVDNDVVVTPGWLESLLDCAEMTGAAVVGPLVCQHEPVHEIVHFAGGQSHIWTDVNGRRRLREKMQDQGKQVAAVRDRLTRCETELSEFHCTLIRRSSLERLGGLDPAMFNTKEHLDFCMSVRDNGETVYFEPDSLVTYLPGPPQHWSDVHFYMLRWSDAWTIDSLSHLRTKWKLAEDGYFKAKYKRLGWRRYDCLIDPLMRRLSFGLTNGKSLATRAVAWLEHPINRLLTALHRKQQRHQKLSAPALANDDYIASSSLPCSADQSLEQINILE